MGSRLARRELDRQVRESEVVRAALARPSGGWIRAAREAMGMSQRDLADRLEKSQEAVAGYEQREQAAALRISTLSEVAEALDCDLVYGLVPKAGSFQEMVDQRAKQLAAQELSHIAQTMELEAQGIDAERFREMVEDRAEQIIKSKRLWK